MASTRQLKHHARFHAAVLRNLFSSSTPPPSPPPPSSAPTTHVHASLLSNEDADLQVVQPPRKVEEVVADNYYDNNDVENKRNHPSRAQRKRLKLKKLKERQAQAKRYIGPLFPDGFEKERQECHDCISGDSSQQGSSIAEECRHRANKEEEGKVVCDASEPESLSRTKRRRLAKKKHCDNLPRHPPGGSLFTAEVEGKNIFVKRMT